MRTHSTTATERGGESSTSRPRVSTLLYKTLRARLFPALRRKLAAAGLVAAALLGCAADAALRIAPLGTHLVVVGETWALQLAAEDATPPLQWRVLRGPAQALPLAGGRACLLTWTPSVYDLAPTKAGAPRQPGPLQLLAVEVRDASGATAQSSGAVGAVPAPAP